MAQELDITPDKGLVDELTAAFDLRDSNARALMALVQKLFNYDSAQEQIMHIATGGGKTYLMAAFIEYLRRQGYKNVVIVTPSLVIQDKTVGNFSPASRKHIAGVPAQDAPLVFTPKNLYEWGAAQSRIGASDNNTRLFIFNVHQIIAPKKNAAEDSVQRGLRRDNEVWGNVFEDLRAMNDLVVILDESHLYTETAASYNAAIRDLDPSLILGLTATVKDEQLKPQGEIPGGQVVFKYPLYQAIKDKNVKTPVIAARIDGYGENEELQLKDALVLLERKAIAYAAYAGEKNLPVVNPILFVVCEDVNHAKSIESLLASPAFFGDHESVLRVDSDAVEKDATVRQRLEDVDLPGSPVRAVVSVAMLGEGWDVKNVGVICSLRVSASTVLTQQVMGRGLRLPYGEYTKEFVIDELDIIAHESFESALRDENVLKSFYSNDLLEEGKKPKVERKKPPTGDAEGTGLGSDTVSGTESGTSTTTSTGTGTSAGRGGSTAVDRNVAVPDSDRSASDHSEESNEENTTTLRNLDEVIPDDTDQEPLDFTGRVEAVDYPAKDGISFWFPRSDLSRTQPTPFDPAKINNDVLTSAAGQVTDSGEPIDRKAVSISYKTRKLSLISVEGAEGESTAVDAAQVVDALTADIRKQQFMERTSDQKFIRVLTGRIRVFVEAVTVPWTERSLARALDALIPVFRNAVKSQKQKLSYVRELRPLELPVERVLHLPDSRIVEQRVDMAALENFSRTTYFGPYQKSLFGVAKFDAKGTEYALAELLEKSSDVTWWKRLDENREETYIMWTSTSVGSGSGRYYPDFVVYEKDSERYWIVEGKRSDEVETAAVQAKAAATLETLNRLDEDARFDGQRWGYIIVNEKQLARPGITWNDVKQYQIHSAVEA